MSISLDRNSKRLKLHGRKADATLPRVDSARKPSTEGTIRSAIQVLVDVCREYGYLTSPKTQTSIDRTTDHWLHLVVTHPDWATPSLRHEITLKLIKHQLCSFFSWGTDQPQPKCDFTGFVPGYLLCGSMGRWLRGLKARCRIQPGSVPSSDFYHWLGLLHSLKLAKRAMPRPDDDMAYHQLCKTYDKLTTFVDHSRDFPSPLQLPLPSDDFWIRELDQFGDVLVMDEYNPTLLKGGRPMNFRSEMTVQKFYHGLFQRYVKLVMSGLNLSHLEDVDVPLYSVSRSATYTNSRGELGMYGDLAWHDAGGYVSSLFPRRNVEETWVYDGVNSFKMSTDLSYEHAKYVHARDACFDEAFKDYEIGIDRNGFEGSMYTSIFSPVIEALKVRSISKGSGASCLFLKCYQSAIHSYLRGIPQFANIGCPVSPSSLSVVGPLDKDERFASIDYESSTDNLDQIWSELASETIFDVCHVPSQARLLWRDSLYNGGVRLSNDPRLIDRFPALPIARCQVTRQMARGQLMGNIMSFPILCLANGFCMWLTRCVSTKRWLHPLCAYAVNGDDAVVRCNREGFDFWGKLAAAMGFPPSVGKVYWSEDFFDFDSECFCPVGRCETPPIDFSEPEDVYFTRVPFCHYGLVRCASRTGHSVQMTELLGCEKGQSVGGIQRYILSRAPKKCVPLLLEDLYRHFLLKPAVYELIRGRPWYLPKCLGGLDMVPVDSDCNILTRGNYSTNPVNFLKINHTGRSGRVKQYTIGPSFVDASRAHFVLSAHLAGGLRIPPAPKRESQVVHAPDDYYESFGFDAVTPSECALASFSAWSEWPQEEPQKKSENLDRAFVRMCRRWNADVRRLWNSLPVGSWPPFWCLSGLTVTNPLVSHDTSQRHAINSWLTDSRLIGLHNSPEIARMIISESDLDC